VPLHAAESNLPARIAPNHEGPPGSLTMSSLYNWGSAPHRPRHGSANRRITGAFAHLFNDADIPYLFHNLEQIPSKTAGMQASVQSVSEAGLKVWQEAIDYTLHNSRHCFSLRRACARRSMDTGLGKKASVFWKPAQTNQSCACIRF